MYTCYYKPWDVVSRGYYGRWRREGRSSQVLAFIEDRPDSHFLKHYRLVAEIFRHLQPYTFLRPGDTAVQVGFHDQYIQAGISQPLMMAAVVGDNGRVIALDPDDTNVDALNDYVRSQQLSNVSVFKQGAWSQTTELDFLMFDDYSSSNTVAEVFQTFREGAQRRWGTARIEQHSSLRRVQVDTLDNLLRETTVDFVNITVNGAEDEVLRGMHALIRSRPGLRIGFPLSNVSATTIQTLSDANFLLAVSDAPHRPWDEEQFFHACAVRCQPEALQAQGFQPATIRELTNRRDNAVGKFEVVASGLTR